MTNLDHLSESPWISIHRRTRLAMLLSCSEASQACSHCATRTPSTLMAVQTIHQTTPRSQRPLATSHSNEGILGCLQATHLEARQYLGTNLSRSLRILTTDGASPRPQMANFRRGDKVGVMPKTQESSLMDNRAVWYRGKTSKAYSSSEKTRRLSMMHKHAPS